MELPTTRVDHTEMRAATIQAIGTGVIGTDVIGTGVIGTDVIAELGGVRS